MDRLNIPKINSERWLCIDDLDGEKWNVINGYEDYHISNYGRVKTFKKRGDSINGVIHGICINRNGYCVLKLYKDGKWKYHLVHRLVAEAFVPNPNNEAYVNHKDENPQNNRADNLEWCSLLYNRRYGTGIERSNRGKYKKIKGVSVDGNHIVFFDGLKDVEIKTNGYFKRINISQCLNKRQKTHNGYKWYYNG